MCIIYNVYNLYNYYGYFGFFRSNEPDRFSVVYGSVDLNEEINVSDVEEITFHQGYNVQSRYNDISILKLNKALVFGPNIQPTVLPKLNDPTLELATSTFVGWGSSEVILSY